MKYKGKYRILPELDCNTGDFPRDNDGNIAYGYSDIFIDCRNGNKIFSYGHMPGNTKTMWLYAYIPSISRGRYIKKILDDKNIAYLDYRENDFEAEFLFKAKDIDLIAKLMKAKTGGANISPFSIKNLPKSNIKIPTENIKDYKEIIAKIRKSDLLIIHKFIVEFLEGILQKKQRKADKAYDYRADMGKKHMMRQAKEFVWSMGYWDEFLKFLNKKVSDYYSRQGVNNAANN